MPSRGLSPGISSSLELGMRFAHWADLDGVSPTPKRIMCAFGVSRATAFRYLDAYRNFVSVRGAQRATKPGPENPLGQ